MTTAPRNTEAAPSLEERSVPTITRIVGMMGFFLLALGVVSIIAGQYGRGLFGPAAGYLFAVMGLGGLLVHAVRDGEVEFRRLYGGFALVLMFTAVVVSLIPGAEPGSTIKSMGYYFFPWGLAAAFLGLLFLVPAARHETVPFWDSLAENIMLGVGAALTIGAVLGGIISSDFLVGPAPALAVLGIGFLCAYFGQTDTSEELGFQVAVGLGIVGLVAIVVGLARSIVPTILYEGPTALQNAYREYELWFIVGRLILIGLALGVAALALNKAIALWLRSVLAVVGLAFALTLIVGSFASPLNVAPTLYFVPYGLILTGIGVIFSLVAVTICTDYPLVVLTRRELSAYFYSPIAYIVLWGMAFVAALGYVVFIGSVLRGGDVIPEPIVGSYPPAGYFGAFSALFLVPALTMRLFSEERRLGTLEVLLTAPVNELTVVMSKFLASWAFFMLCWVPAGLYLVALRSAGGMAFDYRPLLSYYLALAASGAAFVAMGLFFSALTRDQIIAAVLTFAGMMAQLLSDLASNLPLSEGVRTALGKFSYLQLWNEALNGQLPLQGVLIQSSMMLFWLFLTLRVVEARKWS